jgi:hypothetical protein
MTCEGHFEENMWHIRIECDNDGMEMFCNGIRYTLMTLYNQHLDKLQYQ